MAGLLSKIAGGVNKFADELLLPTTGLGKLGAFLGAAAGNDLGTASMMALRDQRSQADTELERQIKEMRLQQARNPVPGNDYERIVARLGQEQGDRYLSSIAAGPPMAVDAIDPVTGNTVRSFIPRTQLPNFNPAPSQAAGPAPGTVVDGFRFKGGNLNDRTNWEPVGGAPPQGGVTFP